MILPNIQMHLSKHIHDLHFEIQNLREHINHSFGW